MSTNPITLSRLQQEVKAILTDHFYHPVQVVAEVAAAKVNQTGHCYLELVEKGEKDGIPKAQARAVIWRSHYATIASAFEAQTGRHIEAGIKILASVVVTYHELYGFSLQIVAIDPSYTLGDMEQQRRATIERLEAEGVIELNHTLQMPLLVQRIALLSSSQAAGYQDFTKELARHPYAFHITLFEATMQGPTAEDSLIAALEAVAEREEEFDAVVIVRGGGATSDLTCFNSYRLSAHIAQFPLPVITGIGHDKDQSVADLVAHTTLKTPTAAAGWLIERMQQIDSWLEGAALKLRDVAHQLLRSELLRLQRHEAQLRTACREGLLQHRLRLEQAAKLLPERIRYSIERARQRLDRAAEGVESRSPQRILQLGFAIVRSEGKAVKKCEELRSLDHISIELSDGSVELKNASFDTPESEEKQNR